MSLEMLVQVVTVAGFVGGAFYWAVLRPLETNLIKLEALLDELRKDMRDNEEKRHEMEVKIAEIDQRARSAHHRLDDLVDICEKKHNIKIPHPRTKGESA